MPVHRSGPARMRRLTVAGLLLTAFSLLTALPSAALTPTAADVPARGSAYMGIGVSAHDGRSGSPVGQDATQTEGVDVSSYQGSVAWSTLWGAGTKWAYTKASEGTSYTNPSFSSQYSGAYAAGMIRGAYHFATPDTSTGATQASYFVAHGGGWSKDGRTLPGVLDIEWNPYGASCYGLSQSGMVSWISGFLNQYKALTGRDAVIYTATSWWTQCTGNYAGFAGANPLWIARYASAPGTLPAGWSVQTMWQYTSTGATVGDHDKFNGALDRVVALANG